MLTKPINATRMPPVLKIKAALRKIRSTYPNFIWTQVWYQTWHEVRYQVGHRAQEILGKDGFTKVWTEVGQTTRRRVVKDNMKSAVDSIVGNFDLPEEIFKKLEAHVEQQVSDQAAMCAYFAMKEFLNIKYEHPVFNIIRLGIIIVIVNDIVRVFGKNGKYLGTFKGE